MNSKQKGDLSEAKILTRLLELNLMVLVPNGDHMPFDLVVYYPGEAKYVRGQVKTGKYTSGAVRFKTHNWNPFTKTRKSYKGLVDVFWVYCPALGTTYEIPENETGDTDTCLRVEAPKNGSKKKAKLAKDYLL